MWWRAESRSATRSRSYRFLLAGPTGYRWLTAAGRRRPRRARRHRLPAGRPTPPPPAWARDAVVYQIFPDRFARSAAAGRPTRRPTGRSRCDWDDPGDRPRPGDAAPALRRRPRRHRRAPDHIDALGVNTVYLTPIFPARSNHRYDAASFDRVDPLLGGDEALARLADAVHARGLAAARRHDHQPHRRRATSGSPPRADVARPSGSCTTSTRDAATTSPGSGVKPLPKLNWGSAELRRRFVDGRRRGRPALAAPAVRAGRLAGRRGQHDRPAAAPTRTPTRWRRCCGRRCRRPGRTALLIAEHGHDATGDLDRGGWHGTMNYAGFTVRCGRWLRAGDEPVPNFLGAPGGVRRRDAGAMLATMRASRSLVSWRSYDPLLAAARLARLGPDPDRGRRRGPAGGGGRPARHPARAPRWSSPETNWG